MNNTKSTLIVIPDNSGPLVITDWWEELLSSADLERLGLTPNIPKEEGT